MIGWLLSIEAARMPAARQKAIRQGGTSSAVARIGLGQNGTGA
jgi:hypothetical protein